MGWPGCNRDECNNWPAVGFTGLCEECIKNPIFVEIEADRLFNVRIGIFKDEAEDIKRFRYIHYFPEIMQEVLDLMSKESKTLREAIDKHIEFRIKKK